MRFNVMLTFMDCSSIVIIIVGLVFLHFSIPVSSLKPEMKAHIQRFYRENYQHIAKKYQKYVNNSGQSSSFLYDLVKGPEKNDPCIFLYKKYEILQGEVNWKNIKRDVILDKGTKMFVDLGSQTYMQVPAVIKCTVKKKDPLIFYIIFFAKTIGHLTSNGNIEFVALYEYGTLFAVAENLKIKIIKETYSDAAKYEKAANIYKQYRDQKKAQIICRKNVQLLFDEFETILDAAINIGKLAVRLDEKETVDIPGVIYCKYRLNNNTENIINFLISEVDHHTRKFNYLSRIIDSSGVVFLDVYSAETFINDKWAYALGEHLEEPSTSSGPHLLK